jgi:phage baseplate assembly protein W
MARELQAPFGLTPSGAVAVVTVPGDMVQQHIKALVSTDPGERVMRPTYGVALSAYLFSGSADVVSTVIAQDVRRAVTQWEPSVNVQDVNTLVSDTSEGVSAVDVQYSPGAAVTGSTTVSTATVLVGGSIVGN